jgi:hypothetical protein
MIMGVLLAFGMAAIVLLVMLFITGTQHPRLFHIEWLAASLSMIVVSLLIIIFTSRLKSMVWKSSLHHQQVPPIDGILTNSVPIRCKIETV